MMQDSLKTVSQQPTELENMLHAFYHKGHMRSHLKSLGVHCEDQRWFGLQTEGDITNFHSSNLSVLKK